MGLLFHVAKVTKSLGRNWGFVLHVYSAEQTGPITKVISATTIRISLEKLDKTVRGEAKAPSTRPRPTPEVP